MNLELNIEQYGDLDRKERKKIEKDLQKKYNDKNIRVYGTKYLNQKKSVTRKMKRQLHEEVNILEELLKIQNQYFPELPKMFKKMTDIRNPKKTTYKDLDVFMISKLLGFCSGINTNKGLTDDFKTIEAVSNINNILNTDYEDIPHYDTIDDVFKNIKTEELESIQTFMIKKLIRSKLLDKFRYNGYFQIIIDATMLYSTRRDLGKFATTKTFKKETEEEYTLYGYYVLEAKLVCGNYVFSFATEFVENATLNSEEEKQDCELKAAYRLLKKIRKRFPKMPFIISGDALYASKKFMDFSTSLEYEYIIRYKKGSMSTIMEEFERITKVVIDHYEYVNNLGYGSGTKKSEGVTNVIRYAHDDEDFMFITSFKIDNKNYKDMMALGRNRWMIENEGFNEQKNGVLEISHKFSEDYNVTKVNYLLMQFAHTLLTLLNHGDVLVKRLRETKKRVSYLLKILLTHTHILNQTNQIQLRLT